MSNSPEGERKKTRSQGDREFKELGSQGETFFVKLSLICIKNGEKLCFISKNHYICRVLETK